MKLIGILLALASMASIGIAHAAEANNARLPAGDNVQSQTQAKVRQTKPRPHHKRKKHRELQEDKSVTQ